MLWLQRSTQYLFLNYNILNKNSVEDVTLPAEHLREVLFMERGLTFLIACKAFNMSVCLPAALALMFHTVHEMVCSHAGFSSLSSLFDLVIL